MSEDQMPVPPEPAPVADPARPVSTEPVPMPDPAAAPIAIGTAPKKKLPRGVIIGIAAAVAAAAVVSILFGTKVLCFHQWSDPTCTEPRICANCDRIKGAPFGHTPGTEAETRDLVTLTLTRTVSCETCGEMLSSESESIKSLVSASTFIFSPVEFCDRLQSMVPSSMGITFSLVEIDGVLEIKVEQDGKSVGMIGFSSHETDDLMGPDDKNSAGCADTVLCVLDESAPKAAGALMVTMIKAVDPSVNHAEAIDIGLEALDREVYRKNGLAYVFAFEDGQFMYAIGIA